MHLTINIYSQILLQKFSHNYLHQFGQMQFVIVQFCLHNPDDECWLSWLLLFLNQHSATVSIVKFDPNPPLL